MEPWNGKDLLLLVTTLISSSAALYYGLKWHDDRIRDVRIKAIQKHWYRQNAAKKRALELEKNAAGED